MLAETILETLSVTIVFGFLGFAVFVLLRGLFGGFGYCSWRRARTVPGVLSGRAKAIDGDTIRVRQGLREITVRIVGIDAPEARQKCLDPKTGRRVACGRNATKTLAQLLKFGGHRVECHVRPEPDRYGRRVGTVYVRDKADGVALDVGRQMVRLGAAIAAYPKSTYAVEEEKARSARLGIHAYVWQEPEDHRHKGPLLGDL